MSGAAQIRDLVENAVAALSGKYEERIKALEDRVAALEAVTPRTAPTGRPRNVKAAAGTASAAGNAKQTGS